MDGGWWSFLCSPQFVSLGIVSRPLFRISEYHYKAYINGFLKCVHYSTVNTFCDTIGGGGTNWDDANERKCFFQHSEARGFWIRNFLLNLWIYHFKPIELNTRWKHQEKNNFLSSTGIISWKCLKDILKTTTSLTFCVKFNKTNLVILYFSLHMTNV